MTYSLKHRINATLEVLFKNCKWSATFLSNGGLCIFSNRCKDQTVLSLRWFNHRNAFELSYGISDQFSETMWLVVSIPFLVRWYVCFSGKPMTWIKDYAGQYQAVRTGILIDLGRFNLAWRNNEMDYEQNRGWSKSIFWHDIFYGACQYTYVDGDKVSVTAYIPLIGKHDAESFMAVVTPRMEIRSYCNRMIPTKKRMVYIVTAKNAPLVKCRSNEDNSLIDHPISEYACCADNPTQAVAKYCHMVTEMRRIKRFSV